MSRVVVVSHRGGPDVLKVSRRPCPQVRHGTVRIVVHTVGVAFGDTMRRRGLLVPPVMRFVPGYDVV